MLSALQTNSASALILIVHGSSDDKWCDQFRNWTQQLKKELGKDRVFLAFMEIADPSLEKVVKEEARKGKTEFQVLPIFMSSGGHVDKDIPKLIAEIRRSKPDLSITQLPPIGIHPEVRETMTRVAGAYLDPLQ
ncbi:MAG: sirohydrochlorin cobaltochelatase [Candidatus Marinamargulisbacteria bacterium]